MPIGPSHSKSSSSRSASRSSTRSRTSGGGFRNSSHTSSHRRGGVSIHIWGRGLTINPFLSFLISLLLIGVIISGIMIGVCVSSKKYNLQRLDTMKQDSVFYYDLIKNGTKGIATIKADKDTDDGFGLDVVIDGNNYYFVEYELVVSEDKKIIGATYTQFSEAEIRIMRGTRQIEIAYDEDGYSINTNYTLKNKQYEQIENLVGNNNKNIKICLAILVVSGFFIIVCIAFAITKGKRQSEKDYGDPVPASPSPVATTKHCPYCGCLVSSDSKKCNNCGAGLK